MVSYQRHLKSSFIKFVSQNQKSFMFKFQYQYGKKQKSGKNFSSVQNRAIRGLQIGASFRDYKLGQERLHIGAAWGISNWGKKIANRGRDFKLQQRDFKLGQRLQIEVRGISNQDRNYKLVQNKCFRENCIILYREK